SEPAPAQTLMPLPNPNPGFGLPQSFVAEFTATIYECVDNAHVVIAEVDVDLFGDVVGGRIKFRSLADVTVNVALHEFTHAAGVFHASRPDFVMFPFVTELPDYAPAERAVLQTLVTLEPGELCPPGSSVLVLQM